MPIVNCVGCVAALKKIQVDGAEEATCHICQQHFIKKRVGTPVEVALLKQRAARYHKQYFDLLPDYDCGRAMCEYFHPESVQYKKMFNETMDELAKIDPECPKERL